MQYAALAMERYHFKYTHPLNSYKYCKVKFLIDHEHRIYHTGLSKTLKIVENYNFLKMINSSFTFQLPKKQYYYVIVDLNANLLIQRLCYS